jgi:hypothetical protein
MIMRTLLRSSLLFLAVAIVGCSTQVAVSPKGSTIADYKHNPVTGNTTMTGDINGDTQSAFHAANTALDSLGYFRVGQDTSSKTEAYVYARGIKDVYVTVGITPSITPGQITLAVTLSSGSLPDTQAIFSAVLERLQSGQH